jgi:hypothetical protein
MGFNDRAVVHRARSPRAVSTVAVTERTAPVRYPPTLRSSFTAPAEALYRGPIQKQVERATARHVDAI